MQSDHAPSSSVQSQLGYTLIGTFFFFFFNNQSWKVNIICTPRHFFFANYNHLFQEQKQFPNISLLQWRCFRLHGREGGVKTPKDHWGNVTTHSSLSRIPTSFSSDRSTSIATTNPFFYLLIVRKTKTQTPSVVSKNLKIKVGFVH